MYNKNNQIKYQSNKLVNFADEIIIGDNPIISKNSQNYSSFDLLNNPPSNNSILQEKPTPNYLFNFSIGIISVIATFIILSKVVTVTFSVVNDFFTTAFVGGYFLLFISTLILISKRKILSLEVKNDILHIKSFPALNKKIPINQILKCEVNTSNNTNSKLGRKIHFAINENGNKYKQPLVNGINLQLIDGNNIIIGSYKS